MRLWLVLCFLLAAACARPTVSREKWQALPREDRELYVQSLLGEEKAKDAKGNRGGTYPLTAGEYRARIDRAYAGGDTRAAHEIFATLAR